MVVRLVGPRILTFESFEIAAQLDRFKTSTYLEGFKLITFSLAQKIRFVSKQNIYKSNNNFFPLSTNVIWTLESGINGFPGINFLKKNCIVIYIAESQLRSHH